MLPTSTRSNSCKGTISMVFIDNKYTKIYYIIIKRAQARNHVKTRNDGYQKHHIIPKCIGGTDDVSNIVVLTYKEHRVCHCLLIKMQISKTSEIKMRHAYGFFNKSSRFNGPRYKRGKENIFSSPEIIQQVKSRMKTNNPMKNPEIKKKCLQNRKLKRELGKYRKPRILKDKFVTPYGIFKTKKEIQEKLKIPEFTLNSIFNNLDAYPTSNGRKSKRIDHLLIDCTKTWKENGFGYVT